ncbi:MAG TPA: transglutaminase-like domain-containing protein [Blastocatellia bacterium]|nr:transglutaminase-like domain-containing protein [Blastocatellia bacterium]
MKQHTKQVVLGCALIACLIVILSVLRVGWPARFKHTLTKARTRAELRLARWRNQEPRMITIAGHLVRTPPRTGAMAGAEIEALDSASGWASLTDGRGRFLLRDVLWYPRAVYNLVLVADEYEVKQMPVTAPSAFPADGLWDVGDIDFDLACKVDPGNLNGRNSISYVEYDRRNDSYYRSLFDKLTTGLETDEEKAAAINRFVGGKLTPSAPVENSEKIDSEQPRAVLERGSQSCGRLALAFATICAAGYYNTRLIDLIDSHDQPDCHMVAEVYYGDRWHLYDPAIGQLRTGPGTVPGYRETRLDANLLASHTVPEFLLTMLRRRDNWLPSVFNSGLHHYYYFKKRGTSGVIG